jgi:putative transposase
MANFSASRYFKTSLEIIRLTVMHYVRYPLPLRNVEDLLHERGIEISHQTARFWWNRSGRMFAAEMSAKACRPDAVPAPLAWSETS